MRKENDIQDFDLKVRSLLENAEVKAPSGAWKAVSARLGSSTSAYPYWRWAAGGLAFAAILSAVLVFNGTFGGASMESPTVAVAVAETAGSPALQNTSDIEEPDAGVAVIPQKNLVAATIRKNPAKAVVVEDITLPEEKSEVPEEGSRSEVVTENRNTEKEAAKSQEWIRDPFLELEEESAPRSRKPSITLGGNLTGNDNAQAGRTWMGVNGPGSKALKQTGKGKYGVPVSLGLGVRLPLTDNLLIGTGLDWSMLTTDFAATYDGKSGDARHNMHYLGIPVNLYYTFIHTGTFSVYVYGGGAADLCLSSRYHFKGEGLSASIDEHVKGLQFSADAGLGFSFKLTGNLKLYVDPAMKYWFKSGHPDNIRTSKPLGFNVEAGLRLDL